MHHSFIPKGICSSKIEFDLDEKNVITNVAFKGGCNGNLKAISKLVNGMSVKQIFETLKGNTCGINSTSCADQLAIAVMEAAEKENLAK